MTLEQLPAEIIYEVLDVADKQAVLNLRTTSQQMYEYVTPLVWSHLYCFEVDTALEVTDENSLVTIKSGAVVDPSKMSPYYHYDCRRYCENRHEFYTKHTCVRWGIILKTGAQIDEFVACVNKGELTRHLPLIKMVHFTGGQSSPRGLRLLQQLAARFDNAEMPNLNSVEVVEMRFNVHEWSHDTIVKGCRLFGDKVKKKYHLEMSNLDCDGTEVPLTEDITTLSIRAVYGVKDMSQLKRAWGIPHMDSLPSEIKYVSLDLPKLDARELGQMLRHATHIKVHAEVTPAGYNWVPASACYVDAWHRNNYLFFSENGDAWELASTQEDDSIQMANVTSARLNGVMTAAALLAPSSSSSSSPSLTAPKLYQLQRLNLSRVATCRLMQYFEYCSSTGQATFFERCVNLRQLVFKNSIHSHIIECLQRVPPGALKSLVILKGGKCLREPDGDLYQMVRLCKDLDFFCHEGTHDPIPTPVLAFFGFYCPQLYNLYLVSPKNGVPLSVPSAYKQVRKPLYDGYSLLSVQGTLYRVDTSQICIKRRTYV